MNELFVRENGSIIGAEEYSSTPRKTSASSNLPHISVTFNGLGSSPGNVNGINMSDVFV